MKDNDLISRAEAIDAIVGVTAFPDADYIKNLCENPAINEDWLGGVCDAINAVEKVNVVDATLVIHAYWINCSESNDGTICRKCSACKDMQIHYRTYYPNYCPECGAKMDGERRNKSE